MRRKSKVLLLIGVLLLISLISGCVDDAQVASQNLVHAADNFEIDRRIVFFNGITDKYLLEIEGKCAVFDNGLKSALEVMCKTGPSQFKKHFLGLSDNVAYFVEQLEPVSASAYRYRVTFKPQAILPTLDVRIK